MKRNVYTSVKTNVYCKHAIDFRAFLWQNKIEVVPTPYGSLSLDVLQLKLLRY